MRYSECCHYDEGYDDGLRDAKTDGLGDGLSLDLLALLERVTSALYAADSMSLLALECDATRKTIIDIRRGVTA